MFHKNKSLVLTIFGTKFVVNVQQNFYVFS